MKATTLLLAITLAIGATSSVDADALPDNFTLAFWDPTGWGSFIMESQRGFEYLNRTLDSAACSNLGASNLWGPDGDREFWRIRTEDPHVQYSLCRYWNKNDFFRWFMLQIMLVFTTYTACSFYAFCVRVGQQDLRKAGTNHEVNPGSWHHKLRGLVLVVAGILGFVFMMTLNVRDGNLVALGIFQGNPELGATAILSLAAIAQGSLLLLQAFNEGFLHVKRIRPLYTSLHLLNGGSILVLARAFPLDRTVVPGTGAQQVGAGVYNSSFAIVLSVVGTLLVLRVLFDAVAARTRVIDPWYGNPEWNLQYCISSIMIWVTFLATRAELTKNVPSGFFQLGFHWGNWPVVVFVLFALIFAFAPLILMFLQFALQNCCGCFGFDKESKGILIHDTNVNDTDTDRKSVV